jgi:hypothetical protein
MSDAHERAVPGHAGFGRAAVREPAPRLPQATQVSVILLLIIIIIIISVIIIIIISSSSSTVIIIIIIIITTTHD